MAQKNWLLLAAFVAVFGVSAIEALYFAGYRFTYIENSQVDSLAYVFPFQPVALMYAVDINPWLGVPLNLLSLFGLLYCSAFFSHRPRWQKLALFIGEWLILSILGSVMVLKAVWNV
jgi:hypothetical protein